MDGVGASLMRHSAVKMTVKMISISSKKSFVALVSPLGRGVNTVKESSLCYFYSYKNFNSPAKEMQVPRIVNKIKISNHFASVICKQKTL